ncbi:tripartite tricarboxylate transporter TctB family protein [Oceanobacillus timonensis]|uniref:tripartite tricarboxylate transporter TctB family protein n=1 Tax=Oceanobacillus timonensis TaxID=1926285 RepID=UPI0009B9946D|nr:tripartite tricarboxylate transporter TctB family protein [Oceanobacillus timonensis]
MMQVTIRYAMPLMFIIGSVIYGTMIIQLDPATLGNPNGPKFFPLFVCAGLLVFSIADLVNVRKQIYAKNKDLEQIAQLKSFKLIGMIIGICVVYALIFEIVGYLIATLLFMAALMFYLNGMKKWRLNVIVTLVVSVATWYSFTELLQISLP